MGLAREKMSVFQQRWGELPGTVSALILPPQRQDSHWAALDSTEQLELGVRFLGGTWNTSGRPWNLWLCRFRSSIDFEYFWISLNNNGMASPLANGPHGSSWAERRIAIRKLRNPWSQVLKASWKWSTAELTRNLRIEFEDRNHYFATKMEPQNPNIRNWKRCCQRFFHCLRWTKETTNLDQISGSFPLSISRNRKSITNNCLWLHAPYVPLWEYRHPISLLV